MSLISKMTSLIAQIRALPSKKLEGVEKEFLSVVSFPDTKNETRKLTEKQKEDVIKNEEPTPPNSDKKKRKRKDADEESSEKRSKKSKKSKEKKSKKEKKKKKSDAN
jgi:hypothetical protein